MDKKPAAKKTAKKPKAGKSSPGEHFRGPVELKLLFDAPELAAVPTLPQAAAMDIDREGPACDWERLYASIHKHGVLEDLKAVKQPDGRWAVYDGRSRREGAQQIYDKGNFHRGKVMVSEITAEQASVIVMESLSRRNVPDYVLAYLRCLEFEGQLLAKKRGRPVKSLDEKDAVSQQSLADDLSVSVSVVNACVGALRWFQDHPADREKDEPKILAGLLSPERAIHAATGREATADKPRKPSSFESWLPKAKSFTSTIRDFDKWTERARANAADALTKEACEWSNFFRTVMANALSAAEEADVEKLRKKTLVATLTEKGGKKS